MTLGDSAPKLKAPEVKLALSKLETRPSGVEKLVSLERSNSMPNFQHETVIFFDDNISLKYALGKIDSRTIGSVIGRIS